MSPEIQTAEADRYADYISTGLNNVQEAAQAEPIVKEPAIIEEDIETDEGEEDTAEKPPRRKRGGSFQKKILRLKDENSALAAEVARLKSSNVETAPQAASEPLLEDYSDWNEFDKARRAYDRAEAKREAVKEALELFESKQREKAGEKEVEGKLKSFNQKQEEARTIHEDYDDAIAEFDDVPVKPEIHQAMLESDLGAEIAYYLAKNPDLFEKLNDPKLSVITLGRELGKIESLLESKKTSKSAVEVSKAPPPIKPIKAKATSSSEISSDDDYETYRKKRGYN